MKSNIVKDLEICKDNIKILCLMNKKADATLNFCSDYAIPNIILDYKKFWKDYETEARLEVSLPFVIEKLLLVRSFHTEESEYIAIIDETIKILSEVNLNINKKF